MAMIALKCPHIEVSEPRQRARAFFIFLFSFSPKEEREKILFSLSLSARERQRSSSSSFYRDDGVSLPLSLSYSRVSFEISFHREGEARAVFLSFL